MVWDGILKRFFAVDTESYPAVIFFQGESVYHYTKDDHPKSRLYATVVKDNDNTSSTDIGA